MTEDCTYRISPDEGSAERKSEIMDRRGVLVDP